MDRENQGRSTGASSNDNKLSESMGNQKNEENRYSNNSSIDSDINKQTESSILVIMNEENQESLKVATSNLHNGSVSPTDDRKNEENRKIAHTNDFSTNIDANKLPQSSMTEEKQGRSLGASSNVNKQSESSSSVSQLVQKNEENLKTVPSHDFPTNSDVKLPESSIWAKSNEGKWESSTDTSSSTCSDVNKYSSSGQKRKTHAVRERYVIPALHSKDHRKDVKLDGELRRKREIDRILKEFEQFKVTEEMRKRKRAAKVSPTIQIPWDSLMHQHDQEPDAVLEIARTHKQRSVKRRTNIDFNDFTSREIDSFWKSRPSPSKSFSPNTMQYEVKSDSDDNEVLI